MSDEAGSSKGKGKTYSDDEEIGEQLTTHFHKSKTRFDSNAEKEESEKPIKDKGKRIKYSDDKTREQNSTSIPSGLTSEDLSYLHTAYEYDGGRECLSNYIKQQQHALRMWEQMNASATSKKTIEGGPEGSKSGVSESYFTDSDTEDEELELILELEVSDTNDLVIPYETASHHFPDLTLHLIDPLGCDWNVTLTYNGDTHSYVFTQGLSLYLEHYHLIPPAMIQIYLPQPQLNPNHFYIQHQKNLGRSIFEMQVPRSNRLPIPCDLAAKYFNPSKAPPLPDHLQEYPLHLTDHLNQSWEMRFVCFEDEEAYVVVRGWEHYVSNYDLKHKDTLLFFRNNNPTPDGNGNSFIIYHEQKFSFSPDYISPPLCLQMNLLCEVDLRKEDVELGRLEMPGVEIPFKCREKEMVKLTDEDSNEWYVIIVYNIVLREYIIVDGWEEIMRGHGLKAEDMVRFYIPACPDHERHLLIKCAKKKKPEKPDGGSVPRLGASYKGKEKLYIC